MNISLKHGKHGTLNNIKGEYFLYNPKHNFVFCMVQKVGCTFWRRVFHLLTHNETSNLYSIDHFKVHSESIPTLGRFNLSEARSVLQSSTSALFTRDPYERVLSGYLDKIFAVNTYYMTHLGRPIIKMLRRNESNTTCGHDVTFTEFVQYILNMKKNGVEQEIDHHFTPMYTHCLPCDVKYDFVGRMESFDEDSSFLFRKIGLFLNRTILMKKTDSISADIRLKFREAFNAANTFSKCMTLKEMYGRVWTTLQLRGMVNPDVPMPYSPNATMDMIQQAAVRASDPSRVSEFKRRGFINMYKTLDRRLLEGLREYVLLDCKIFGYNDRPAEIFS
ncbi:carbohydrate sulfotransferase 9-like [Ylistrum balloti]|uniref:carbohydrate sulfotransferase 9-like n=1 Tax=Ylistrum balloti TaxID=509963 RepID=UPI0029059D63|nr:carbohydrate sulfotransferase 9-like [Ylistrum balloti]